MLALLLSLAAPPPDPPAVRLPDAVAAPPGRIVRLQAETLGLTVRWALADDGADLVPFPDGKTALFASPTPGRYLVLAWTAAGDVPSDAARCVVVVGDVPVDALAADLKRLAAADSPAQVAKLAAAYREAVSFPARADVRTAGDLRTKLQAAVAAAVPADALVPVRRRIGDELKATLPTDPNHPLDAAARQQAADLFARVAAALEEIR